MNHGLAPADHVFFRVGPGCSGPKEDEHVPRNPVFYSRSDSSPHFETDVPLIVPILRGPPLRELFDHPRKSPPFQRPRKHRKPDDVNRNVQVGVVLQVLPYVATATLAGPSRRGEEEKQAMLSLLCIETPRQRLDPISKVFGTRRRVDRCGCGRKKYTRDCDGETEATLRSHPPMARVRLDSPRRSQSHKPFLPSARHSKALLAPGLRRWHR